MEANTFIRRSTIILLLLANIGISSAQAQERETHDRVVKNIKGVVTIGPNRTLYGAARDYGVFHGVPAGTTNFSELGVYNAHGPDPLPLNAQTDESAVLATYVDPDFVAFLGLSPDSVDPSSINVPLQNVKTLVSKNGVTRGTLPGIFSSVPTTQSIAAPNDPILLRDWLKARGNAVVQCDGKDRGSVYLNLKNLIPNRLYTVWGGIISVKEGLIEQPLGGAPSAFATDERGDGVFKRVLNYCPFDYIDEIQAQLAWIMVVLHSDHMAYGGVFAPEAAGFVGGTTAHVHMEFHLQGQKVTH